MVHRTRPPLPTLTSGQKPVLPRQVGLLMVLYRPVGLRPYSPSVSTDRGQPPLPGAFFSAWPLTCLGFGLVHPRTECQKVPAEFRPIGPCDYDEHRQSGGVCMKKDDNGRISRGKFHAAVPVLWHPYRCCDAASPGRKRNRRLGSGDERGKPIRGEILELG